MSKDIERRLRSLSDEITAIRAELAVLGEQLVFQHDVLEESRVKALVAETPLADREFRIAEDDFRRIQRVLDDANGRLLALRDEQDRLLGAMLHQPAGP
jgi:chromosome segregation ATPase